MRTIYRFWLQLTILAAVLVAILITLLIICPGTLNSDSLHIAAQVLSAAFLL
jgi:hypothetical protein